VRSRPPAGAGATVWATVGRREQLGEIDSGRDPHVLERENQVLGGGVARGAGRERAAAETRRGSILITSAPRSARMRVANGAAM
jgi:hypothetical protein